jgi:NitT/TauT family transport system permease protein
VVWAERFKIEETADAEKPESWVLNLLDHSPVYHAVRRGVVLLRNRRHERVMASSNGNGNGNGNGLAPHGGTLALRALPLKPKPWAKITPVIGTILKVAVVVFLVYGAVRGSISLVKLLLALPIHDPVNHSDWVHILLALLASFARTTVAVLLGAAWTLPAGILIGLSPKWSQRLQPVVQVVASFPAPMLFPLVIIGLSVVHLPFNIACVALMLLGTQWYILFNVIAGAMAIPGELKEVCNVYRTSRWERWVRLYIPCVFPYLVTGMITAAGGAWNATIVAEYVQVKDSTYQAFGLGSIISQATDNNFPLLAAAIVTMAVSVVVLNRLVWRRMYRLAESRYALNA